MSQIISLDWFSQKQEKKKIKHTLSGQQRTNTLKLYFEEYFSLYSTLISIKNKANNALELKIYAEKYLLDLNVLFNINLNLQFGIVNIYSTAFKNHLPILIKSKQFSKIIIKQTLKQDFDLVNRYTNLLIFLENGQISFRLMLPIQDGYKCIFKKLRQIIFGNFLKTKFTNFIQKIIQNNGFQIQKQVKQTEKQKKLVQIYKYFNRTAIQPTLSIKSQFNRQETICQRLLQQRKDLQRLKKYHYEMYTLCRKYFSTIILYSSAQDIFNKNLINQISIYQKESIYEMLYIPQSKNLNSKQNKYIFNSVVFQENFYKSRKVSEGGKSQIHVIRANIIQINSFESFQETQINPSNNKIKEKFFWKHLVIKCVKQTNNLQKFFQDINKPLIFLSKDCDIQQKDNQKSLLNQKVKRQIEIVSRMKLGSCAFLPKFYQNIQKNSPYENYLLSQYIPSSNLRQFMKLHSYSMSLTTKLFIVFQIIQSLRFISRYKIVHLDIKQSNFIVYNRLLIKLLDFQQSYHPQVCVKNYKPDFTIPYAPPEVACFFKGRTFSQKSDVYSLGILMHNIFFNKLPFYFSEESFFEIHHFNQIEKRLFWNSEDNLAYGSSQQIIKIIGQLILKCISSNETERPYLDWLAVAINSCLNYLIQP